MTWKAIAEKGYSWDGGALRVAKFGVGTVSEVTDMTLTDRREGELPSNPMLTGDDAVSFMQAVMDAAYDYGLRPSRAQDEKHLNTHLQDMRDIARHLLKMGSKETKK